MDSETEQAISEVLDGRPRADEIALMVEALLVRRDTFIRERDACSDDEGRKAWLRRIRDVDAQVTVLRQEQAITEFVENEVRAVANRPVTELVLHDTDG